MVSCNRVCNLIGNTIFPNPTCVMTIEEVADLRKGNRPFKGYAFSEMNWLRRNERSKIK